MQLFIQALLVITYVAGTFCQKITFDNTDVGGNTAGRLYIEGTIGENVTVLLHQNWQPFIFIQVKKISDPTFSFMCSLVVSGATCTPDPVDICQCVYNTTRDNVNFVVNGTAGPALYNAAIRAEWQHQNLTTVYSNKNYTVPGPTVTPAPPPDDIVLIVCLSVIIPVVVIAVVIGIVYYCKKKGQSQAVSNNGTGSTAKDKPDQPKQYQEHTNQAYEGRRTSPSNVTMHEMKATANDNLQQHNSHQKDVNNSHIKVNTNGGSASQTVPGEPRQLPPLKGINRHSHLQPPDQPRPPSVEITSHKL